ncbi:MAG: His/Gly/Thr/Pro-type tRNA ligase C-terminal domain-containing protein [Minisyncoccia bacterium]
MTKKLGKNSGEKQSKSHLESVTDKVGETAIHYGFTVVRPPQITSDDISKYKQFKESDHYGDALEKIALTRWYIENRLETEAQPITIHYKRPLLGGHLKKKPNIEMYGFEVMGNTKATSEALILKTILAVLDDLGYRDLYLDINSIGDRESISRFERELQSYFRKNQHILPAKLRNDFKKNHYSFVIENHPESKEFLKNAPQTVGTLSEAGRLHFKEVLESIEAFDVSYKIKPHAIASKHYASYTIFEVRQISEKKEEDGILLAYGYRYNHLAKKIGGKKDISSVGGTILVKKHPSFTKKVAIKNIKKPRFYLVQLGSIAKLKVLNVVEMLRKNKIGVYHSITKDKITGQLNGAEYMKASHVLIMGQKEAIENSIVVRNLINREQETVSLEKLPEFLKSLDKDEVKKKKMKK